MSKSFYPFLFLVLALFIFMCAPVLFTEGMFMDGLIYSTVARNLAEGEGSFWFLKFTDSCMTNFHEHPPLVFGIHSMLYSLLGDNIFIDRFYSFFTFLLSGFLIVLIWNEVTQNKYKEIAWFPLLLWIVMPLVPWAAMNTMLENTMSIFVLAAILFTIKSLRHRRFLYLILSALMLCLAFLSKGFTGLFPLVLPFFLYCFKSDYSAERMTIDSMVIALSVAAFFAILFLVEPQSIHSLEMYLKIQVGNSLQNVVTVDSRFNIVWVLFLKIAIAMTLVLIIFFIGKRKGEKEVSWLFVFLSLGLSGVLPIMISLKQNDFYILCALPCFALALAFWVAPIVFTWVQKIKSLKLFLPISLGVFLLSIFLSFSMKGKYNRDEEIIKDVKKIAQIIPAHTVLEVSKGVYLQWNVQGYFYRYAHISLKLGPNKPLRFYLYDKKETLPGFIDAQKPYFEASRFLVFEIK